VTLRATNLTTRDINILSFLSDQGVATFDQIRNGYFESKVSCYKRLSILKNYGLIRSECIKIGIKKNNKIYLLSETLGFNSITERHMIKHQMELNKVYLYLKHSLFEAIFINDPKIKIRNKRYGITSDVIPDIEIIQDNIKIAIEVERYKKTKNEYLTRFLYYNKSDYTHIIYYFEFDKEYLTVSQLAKSFKKIVFSSIINPKSVYSNLLGFINIKEYLKL